MTDAMKERAPLLRDHRVAHIHLGEGGPVSEDYERTSVAGLLHGAQVGADLGIHLHHESFGLGAGTAFQITTLGLRRRGGIVARLDSTPTDRRF